MGTTLPTPTTASVSRPLLLAAAAAGVLVAAAGFLWVHFGPAVFLEAIVAGLVACF